ncbi:MAG: putative manganese-dependent inorganic diphosphatase [Coriobacteriia bacterium]|nr:putative manganese-dependent inorganic diphosphatase [Coriobacteriia bacterium]
MQPVLVLGHKNPDNDSICSALAYAYLKQQLDPANTYEAVRLGPLPHETRWVFESYGLKAPAVIPHLHSRVCDAMTEGVISIPAGASLLDAGLLMRERNKRALVVTDSEGKYQGLFTTRMLAELFISELESARSRQETLSECVADYLDDGAYILKPDALLKDATDDILNSPLREAVVLDDDDICIGIVTRTDLARTPRRRVILVDHNEIAQGAPGVADAEVLEIVDHHRIGDIQTLKPIQFINYPLGSTATIVTLEFRRHGVPIPRHIAAALLSAIMTDTVLLKSPTCTPTDKEMAEFLGEAIGVEALQFGIDLFGSRDAASPPTIEAITGADAKEFEVGETTVLIAQYETVSLANILEHEKALTERLEQLVAERGYAFALLLITDVIAEGSQLLLAGDPRIVERVFKVSFAEGSVWVPGILSRKKQVAPRILEYI